MKERLQKYLARAGVTSRRKAEDLIKQGRVRVNGAVVTAMGVKIDPERDQVEADGRFVTKERKVYYLLNKPAGYVTTMHDPQGRPIVTDLLPEVRERVFPVGRLDYETEGALLLTNDGNFAHYILHPRFEVNKTYRATVSGIPGKDKIQQLEKGIKLDGQKTWPAKVSFLDKRAGKSTLKIIIHEGKKRQVRKMFAAIGHQVLHLQRTAYGGLVLGGLARGKYRKLVKKDLKKLFFGKIPFTIEKIPD